MAFDFNIGYAEAARNKILEEVIIYLLSKT